MVSFTLNNRQNLLDADAGTALFWALRDHVGLTGTKYGCGAGLAAPAPSTSTARAALVPDRRRPVAGKTVVTIEGLSPNSSIRCSTPGSPKRCRNAATASPGRS